MSGGKLDGSWLTEDRSTSDGGWKDAGRRLVGVIIRRNTSPAGIA